MATSATAAAHEHREREREHHEGARAARRAPAHRATATARLGAGRARARVGAGIGIEHACVAVHPSVRAVLTRARRAAAVARHVVAVVAGLDGLVDHTVTAARTLA